MWSREGRNELICPGLGLERYAYCRKHDRENRYHPCSTCQVDDSAAVVVTFLVRNRLNSDCMLYLMLYIGDPDPTCQCQLAAKPMCEDCM